MGERREGSLVVTPDLDHNDLIPEDQNEPSENLQAEEEEEAAERETSISHDDAAEYQGFIGMNSMTSLSCPSSFILSLSLCLQR